MNRDDLLQRVCAWLDEIAITPLAQFFRGLDQGDRTVLHVLLAAAAAAGFVIGRRLNTHLMNHVTIRMDDGTTQVDHIPVSRFGVFVLETKDYSGWPFGNAADPTWTQVHFTRRFKFQNPVFQNRRHVRAVQGLLDFLPPDAVKSVVVFCGDAEFKTKFLKE